VKQPWWAAFGPAEAPLRCGDAEHRLRWADGKLQAVDHPDAEGELVLAALGSDTSPCLDTVMAWGRHSDDLAVLAVGPRSASDPVTIPAAVLDEATALGNTGQQSFGVVGGPSAMIYAHRPALPRRVASYSGLSASQGVGWFTGRRPRAHPARLRRLASRSSGWAGSRPLGRPRSRPLASYGAFRGGGWPGAEADPARIELIRLLALGPQFQFRLSATVAHAWSADGERASRAAQVRPALTAALAGRLAPAAAQWLGIDPGEVDAAIRDDAEWGEITRTGREGSARLLARLPVGWLAEVWAPGFAVVASHLVVAVLQASWPEASVLALRSPGQDPVQLDIRHDQGHWSVTSR
jgi:hypothetical protein